MNENTTHTIQRRTALKTLGATGIGTLGIAGCLGGGNLTQITMGISGSGTTAGQAAGALQRALDEHSDSVSITTQETGGDPASIRQFDQGNIDAHTATNYAVGLAAEGRPPFDSRPVESLPNQAIWFAILTFGWYGTGGTNYTTSSDVIGEPVWALDPSWGIRQAAEDVHTRAGIWSDLAPGVVNVGSREVAGAIEEDRVNAFIAYGQNYDGLPGWATQVDSRAEVYVLQTADNLIQAAEETPGIQTQQLEPYGWNQDVGRSQFRSWMIPMQFFFGPDVSDDAVYEIARVSHEHYETAQQSMSSYFNHSDIDQMTNYLEGLDVHQGMLNFLSENGYNTSGLNSSNSPTNSSTNSS